MLKLYVMEVEPESMENWLIFWTLFGQLLSDYLEVPTIFNPIGRCADEEGKDVESSKGIHS